MSRLVSHSVSVSVGNIVGNDVRNESALSIPLDSGGVGEVFAEAQRKSVVDVSIEIPGGRAGHTVSPCRGERKDVLMMNTVMCLQTLNDEINQLLPSY
eukprot:scaffold8160_cov144-Skeletonema_dohrnii-CCMP3373.AAC.3